MEQKALGGNSVEFFKEKIEGAEELAKTYADGLVGKVRVLTTADYNWPTNNPDGVALWLLPQGIYATQDGATSHKVYINNSKAENIGYTYFVTQSNGGAVARIAVLSFGRDTYDATSISSGVQFTQRFTGLVDDDIVNALDSSSVDKPLSAAQGKVLNDKIEGRVITGAGAPATSTVGTVGMVYEDTTNGKLYICTDTTGGTYTWKEVGAGDVKVVYLTPTNVTSTTISVTADKTVAEIKGWADADKEVLFLIKLTQGFGGFAAGVYCFRLAAAHTDLVRAYAVDPTTGGVWTYLQNSNDGYNATVTIGAGAPTVVQTTGTSTADVMSQNATTSMVFADSSNRARIRIGAYASSGNEDGIAIGKVASLNAAKSIAIGASASATGQESIALGDGSSATQKGQMDIGAAGTTYGGYNNSNYRLLTGLYDPQNAHDAANKGYVDNSITTAISGIVGVEFEVVQTLPATGDAGTIYLVPNQGATPNIYDEYIYVNNAFEKIGTTEIDLSNYVTNTDLQTTLANYTLSSSLSTVATSGNYNDLINTPSTFTTNEWNALWA